MKKLGLILVFLIILMMIVFIAFDNWYKTSIDIQNSQSNDSVVFIIKPGEQLSSISNRLKDAGLINNKWLFEYYLKKSKLDRKIQAGEYLLAKNLSIVALSDKIQRGSFDASITIKEGLRREEVLEVIVSWYEANQDFPDLRKVKDEFLSLTRDKEGFLFPETYRFPRDVEVKTIVETMRAGFDDFFLEKNEKAVDSSQFNIYQIVTIASLVEREANDDESRKIVAGIIIERLKSGWTLDIDATIQYALGFQIKEKSWWKTTLSSNDLSVDSLYNTREYAGLPPGPICSPSLSSLLAVLNPKNTSYWYYLTGDDGKMYYAETLAVHQQNIVKYLNGS